MDVSIMSKLATLFYDLLGCSLGDHGDKFTSLKFSWLKANFEYLSSIATEREAIWSSSPGIGRLYTLPIYCKMIETRREEDTATIIPLSAHIHSHLWCINAPLLNFSTVEWSTDTGTWHVGTFFMWWANDASPFTNAKSRAPLTSPATSAFCTRTEADTQTQVILFTV
ncbi:hypothetical protein GOBAR_DD19935 [Gossypium barbadense]|nr:hypothetical protein GOBAR_DD19935 [Gossypium barbadense]